MGERRRELRIWQAMNSESWAKGGVSYGQDWKIDIVIRNDRDRILAVRVGAGSPALEEVVNRVRKAILPAEDYHVNVAQTYLQGKVQVNKEGDEEDANTETGNASLPGEPQDQPAENTVEDSIFSLRYSPSRAIPRRRK